MNKRKYDELGQLKGVSPATAEALVAAGFYNVGKVARAKPDRWAAALPKFNESVLSRLEGVIGQAEAHIRNSARTAPVVDASTVVAEYWDEAMEMPEFRFALLKRISAHPPTRACIIRNLVDELDD